MSRSYGSLCIFNSPRILHFYDIFNVIGYTYDK